MVLQENTPLAPLTTFGIGGKARYFAAVSSVYELQEACAEAVKRGVRVFVLGGGSNVLVSDGGFDGLVVKNEIKGMRETIDGDQVLIEAGAGESWDAFVAHCVDQRYWGVENLSYIPGTVGAAPVQNIGAYGVEVGSVIESVKTVDARTGKEERYANRECKFSYRDSVFKRSDSRHLVITSVVFRLSLKPTPNLAYKDLHDRFPGQIAPTIGQIRESVIAIRSAKFPDLSKTGTAGSFWKNPIIGKTLFGTLRTTYPLLPSFPVDDSSVKVPLAWILDNACNLKGYMRGKVGLYGKQPLVLVAEKGATQADVDALDEEVAVIVKQKTGIAIEREVQSIG